jgi:hypothetical protein
MRIQPAAVRHAPGARHDVLLVWIEERSVRQPVLDADDA